MSEGIDVLEALNAIDPNGLSGYEDWMKVGMGLHHEGYGYEVFGDWLRRWGVHFDENQTRTKWRSFGHGSGMPVTGATIIKMALDTGWKPKNKGRGKARAMALDEILYANSDVKPIPEAEMAGASDAEVKPLYGPGHEPDELRDFLNALFSPNEYVGYTVDYKPDEKNPDKMKPSGWGTYTLTAEQLISRLDKGMVNAIGTTHDESGAWIRINPVDGEGVGNDHVTSFRYGLVESDEMDINTFAAKVKKMNLPVAALVYSGRRSLHAIVKVDAQDLTEYKQRMEKLYLRCEKNGIEIDKANKDASRMTRIPGVMRQGKRQYLAGLAQGAGDWEEWETWYEEATDELPDSVPLDTMLGDNLPSLKPALIDGVLRIGHKMLLSGPSKAGKSFLLINLCICLAEGWDWIGFKCRRSKVMYVNLELDEASCFNRFADMYSAFERRGLHGSNARDIDVWNLRGLSEPMDKLLSKLVRRCIKRKTEVVVIDPIYKVMLGDENSAGDMARFANLFDALARQAECSVIYCHHHSKGFQGEKRSIDRASGSGVFGRDPDAILDMVELETDEGDRHAHMNTAICAECERTVTDRGFGIQWSEKPHHETSIEANAIGSACELIPVEDARQLRIRCDKLRVLAHSSTAWRIEGTLREFPSIKPVSAWFDWPMHVADDSLSNKQELGRDIGGKPNQNRKGNGNSESATNTSAKKKNKAIAEAVQSCYEDNLPATRINVLERLQANGFKKPQMSTFQDWTRDRETSKWCEWRCFEEDGEHVLKRIGEGVGDPV